MKLTIPFYLHKAGAGFPSPATDYIEEDVDLNVHLIKNVPATFIIRVQGKSMTDVGIYDGDLLVIDRSLKPKNFSTVVANVHDELVVKSFVRSKDGQFLTSGSKNIEDKIIRTKQIFDRTGASRATKQIIEAYTEKAFRLLDTISISSEKKAPLKQFGIELMNRNV